MFEGNFLAARFEVAGTLDDIALLQGLHDAERIGEVLRYPLQAAGDPDLFALLAVDGQFSHVADARISS